MEDVVQALMMAFAVMVFVIAFSVAMYMFSQVTTTAETLALYTDSTLYYDNVRLDEDASITDEDIRTGKTRIVNAETIIPTLYRYPDEEFCVKIYNSANKLIQIFDLDLEGKVQSAIGDTTATATSSNTAQIANYAYKKVKCAVIVGKISKIKTKNNDDMAFFTGSDETGIADFTVFPTSYDLFKEVRTNELIIVFGEVQRRFDKYQIIVNNIKRMGGLNE